PSAKRMAISNSAAVSPAIAAVRKAGPPMVDGRMSTAASVPEAFGVGGFVGATASGGSGAVETVAGRGSEPVGSVLLGDERCSGAAGTGVNGGGDGVAGGGVASAGIASRCGAADGSGAEFWNSLDLALAPASEA